MTDQAFTALGGLILSLTIGIVGFLILRAVKSVDAKVDQMIQKDTLQDIAIGANKTHVDAQISILSNRIAAAQTSAQIEISAIKEELKWLTEVTRPFWGRQEPTE